MTKKLHRESLIVAVILLILLGACSQICMTVSRS